MSEYTIIVKNFDELEDGRWYLIDDNIIVKYMGCTSDSLLFLSFEGYHKEPKLKIYKMKENSVGYEFIDYNIQKCELIQNYGYLCISSVYPYETEQAVDRYF